MESAKRLKIAIFGGSFDPVHAAHVKLARFAIESGVCDQLIFVPAYQNPHKPARPVASDQDRLAMIKLVLPAQCEVSDFEIKRRGPSYAIETLKYFRQRYPSADLILLVGQDQLTQFHRWRAVGQIVKLARVVFFRTTSAKVNRVKLAALKATLLDNPLYQNRASAYRRGHLDVVLPPVQRYIAARRLYLEALVKNQLSQKRYRHSLATAQLARQYALSLKTDPEQAYYAGLLHDFTKEWSSEKQREFLKKYHYNQAQYQPYQYHSLTAALWAEHVYQINDPALVQAIRVHTSLEWDLSLLDKIVFSADKLSQGRRWPGIQDVRRLILSDFDRGFAKVVSQTWQSLEMEGITPSLYQAKVYQRWSALA